MLSNNYDKYKCTKGFLKAYIYAAYKRLTWIYRNTQSESEGMEKIYFMQVKTAT